MDVRRSRMPLRCGRRPPIPGIPGDRIHYVRKSARADLRWLARPEDAGRAPQGDGYESLLAARHEPCRRLDVLPRPVIAACRKFTKSMVFAGRCFAFE